MSRETLPPKVGAAATKHTKRMLLLGLSEWTSVEFNLARSTHLGYIFRIVEHEGLEWGDQRGSYSSPLPNSGVILRSQQDKMVSVESEDGCLNLGVKDYKLISLLSFSPSPPPTQLRHVIFIFLQNNQHQKFQPYFFSFSSYCLSTPDSRPLCSRKKKHICPKWFPKCVDLLKFNSTLFYSY